MCSVYMCVSRTCLCPFPTIEFNQKSSQISVVQVECMFDFHGV